MQNIPTMGRGEATGQAQVTQEWKWLLSEMMARPAADE